MTSTTTQATTIIPCDDRCMFAKLDDCDCECQGVNHKRGGELTEEQRTIVRTPKGRRIRPLEPGSWQYATARELFEAYEGGGVTREDLAAQYDVSDTTVRRYQRRYELTVALYQHEAAQAAA